MKKRKCVRTSHTTNKAILIQELAEAQVIDEKVGDFEEIPKVTIEDEDDEVYDLDMRCTDWGEAMEFFK